MAGCAYSKSKREDLRLCEGAENRHQVLVFKVIRPPNRDVQDVDGLLLDVLESTTRQDRTLAVKIPQTCKSPARFQQPARPHLGVLLVVERDPGLAEEGALRGGVGKAGNHFIEVSGGKPREALRWE